MKIQKSIRNAVLAAVLGTYGLHAAAQISEVEPNHPFPSAQRLVIQGGAITISGTVGSATGAMVLDADFYSFHAREGDVVTIDIDGAMKLAGRSLDSILTLFCPEGTVFENDDIPSTQRPDAGSINSRDSLLANMRFPKTGIYTIAVTGFPNRLNKDGTYRDTRTLSQSNGTYTLNITGVSPPVQQISMEVKPGSGEYAPVNPKSKGNIPVALLSSAEFDALTVYPDSLTFGATGDEASYLRCGKEGTDVNGDGRLDLVCHFDNQKAEFDVDHTIGIVKGKTASGTLFEGRAMLKVVPHKRPD